MPPGFECDRCDKFVEQERMGSVMYEGEPIERVVICPPRDYDESTIHEYTLCDNCRAALVNWVDDGETTHIHEFKPLSIGFDTYNPYSELEDVPGVGIEKAKALYDAGYKTKQDLQKASQLDLSNVGSIGNALAARIKADVGDYKSAEDVVNDIERILDEFDGS